MPLRGQRRPAVGALMNFAASRSTFHAESTGNSSPATLAFSTASKISGSSSPLSLQLPEYAGDVLECGGNPITSRISPLRSTNMMNSLPQISQLIDDSSFDFFSAPG